MGKCGTCNSNSIERKQYSRKNCKSFQKTDCGLTCCKCRKLICNNCIRKIVPLIEKKKKDLHRDTHTFIEHLEDYYHSNFEKKPDKFVGHCCLVRVKIKEQEMKEQKTDNTGCLVRVQEPDKKKQKTTDRGVWLGGCLILEEFRLIHPPSFDTIDVFGLGSEKNIKALWHFVIDETQALGFSERQVHPSSKELDSTTCDIKINPPHNTATEENFKVRVYFVPKIQECDESLKASNKASDELVKECFYFDPNDFSDGVNVTLLVGYDPNKSSDGGGVGSLLLCRLNNKMFRYNCGSNDTYCHLLLQDLMLELKNSGLERRRTGGSSGELTYSNNLLQLMDTRNSSPRCSTGALWLRGKDEKWHVFYINTKKGIEKKTYYTNPVPGGKFKMNKKLLQDYPLLQKFVLSRPYGAIIIREVEKNLPGWRISPESVDAEIEKIRCARVFLNNRKATTEKQIMLLFCEYYAANFLVFTLVLHAVGRHLDYFQNGNVFLENRICFKFKLNKNGYTRVAKLGKTNGRGGGGLEYCSFALLDW